MLWIRSYATALPSRTGRKSAFMAKKQKPALTHIDSRGEARMVDVSAKPATERVAVAEGCVVMSKATLQLIESGNAKKGDVLGTARVAGIMAAKRTADLIPLCHPLALTHVAVELEVGDAAVTIMASAETTAQTGVEMEALTAASVAALTVYDMAKAVDKELEITGVRLVEKTKEPA